MLYAFVKSTTQGITNDINETGLPERRFEGGYGGVNFLPSTDRVPEAIASSFRFLIRRERIASRK